MNAEDIENHPCSQHKPVILELLLVYLSIVSHGPLGEGAERWTSKLQPELPATPDKTSCKPFIHESMVRNPDPELITVENSEPRL